MKSNHANHVFIIGRVIQTWVYDCELYCRIEMKKVAPFADAKRGVDLVTVVLPGAHDKGVEIEKGETLHVLGFVQNEDREIPLGKLARNDELPEKYNDIKVTQIVTEVHAKYWSLVNK